MELAQALAQAPVFRSAAARLSDWVFEAADDAALCPPGVSSGADTLAARRYGWAASATEPCTFGAQRGIAASPVVDAAAVYVGSDDGVLYGLALANGSVMWALPLAPGRPIGSSAVLSRNGTLLVGAHDGALHAFAPPSPPAPPPARRALLEALAGLRARRVRLGLLDERAGEEDEEEGNF